MCQNCEQIREQLQTQATAKQENRASNLPEGKTMLLTGSTKVVIKPFETLDDALEIADKVSKLLYPETENEELSTLKHEAAITRAAAVVSMVNPADKAEALVGLLGAVLMSFNPDDLATVKVELQKYFELVARDVLDHQTKEFIASSGLVTSDLKK